MFSRNLRNRMKGSHEATRRAASLPIFLCHGLGIHIHLSYFCNMVSIHFFNWIFLYYFLLIHGNGNT